MKVEVITRRQDLPALSAEWDALAATERRDGFFRTSGWYSAWMEHIRPSAEPFVLVARTRTGKLAGIAPLCRTQYCDLGFRLGAVAWAGREVVSGDFLDFLVSPEEPAARAELLEAVWQHRSEWGLLVLGELTAGSESEAAAEVFGARHGLALRRQEERICPYISLPDTFDGYLNTLSSSTRYHIRRRIRDVGKRGAVVETFTAPEDVAARIDTMMDLHLARWRSDGQPGTFGRPGFRDFMRAVCVHPPAGSVCRLYMLMHEGRAAAALLTFQFGDTALYYQAGWDPDSQLASLSPGVVVMAASINDAISQGLKYYEFLRGDETYKSRWTATYRTTSTLLAARSAGARAYLHTAALKDIAKGIVARHRPAPAALPPEPAPESAKTAAGGRVAL